MNITINGVEFMTVCTKHKEAYYDWCSICFNEYEEEPAMEIKVNVDFGYMKGLELAEGKGWAFARFLSLDSDRQKLWDNIGKLGGIEWTGEDDPVENDKPIDRVVDNGIMIIIYYGNGTYHKEGDWTEITQANKSI